jgi:hypothetical protein
MDEERTFRVVFEMTATNKNAMWFGTPTKEWIKYMVSGPGSVWKLEHVQIEEVTR